MLYDFLISRTLGLSDYHGASKILVIGGICLYTLIKIAGFTLGVRRVHDLGSTGWLILLGLIPFASIIFYLYIYCDKGNAEENKFGIRPQSQKLKLFDKIWISIFVVLLIAYAVLVFTSGALHSYYYYYYGD